MKFREILTLRKLPTLSANQLLLLTVAWLAATQNVSLFEAIVHSLPRPFGGQEWRILASSVYALVAFLTVAMAGLCWPRVQKPAMVVFILVAAVSSYFMHAFGTIIDHNMIANAFNTNAREAGDLLTFDFFMHTLLLGALPAWVVVRVPLRFERFGVELRRRLTLVGVMLVGLVIVLFSQYNTLSFWGRENRNVRLYLNPTAPMYALKQALADLLPKGPPVPLIVIAPDAVRKAAPDAKPLLVVLVVGETARAANFGIDGYARNTTPRLSAMPDLINYPHIESCGTATLISVPCIFSRLDQADFSRKKAAAEENLLDIVKRAGVPVIWRDNNAGCMGTCVRTGLVSFENEKDPEFCADGECHDDILLKDFDAVVPKAPGSATFLVLHQKGSHGPAYFKRYPESARHFTPDCRIDSVQRCSREEIVNAYDNTIVYTDSMLANLIEQLRARQDRVNSVMIYASDHGESLGENGIYLHGLPRQIAPAEQTHIPMMAWFSAQAPAALGLDMACVKAASNKPGSHDNIFDSILNLLSIHTAARKSAEDLFAACQKH